MKRWVSLTVFFGVLLLHFVNFAQDKVEAPASLPKALSPKDIDDLFSAQFGFYSQEDGKNNSGGNVFLDESEMVYEGIILLDKSVSERDRINVRFLGDIVSSASIARYDRPQYRALQSEPSGNKHAELGGGWNHAFNNFSAGINGSFGAELSRYYSGGFGANVGFNFNENNTRLTLRYQGYIDHFQEKLFTGLQPGYEQRYSHTGEIGVTQMITPKTTAQVIFNHTHQLGYLATTYYSVYVNNVETQELAPDERRRDSITTRVKQGLMDSNAVELGYRFYNDSWDINAHTIDLRFFQYIWDQKILLEPQYRYYNQSRAYFHQIAFTQFFPYMTSDADLSEFNGNMFGIKTTLFNPRLMSFMRGDLEFGFNYFMRSNNLNSYWITTGYSLKF